MSFAKEGYEEVVNDRILSYNNLCNFSFYRMSSVDDLFDGLTICLFDFRGSHKKQSTKGVDVEAAQISPKLSYVRPRLFPNTDAASLLPKIGQFVKENFKKL